MAVLSIVAGTLAGAYLLPHAADFLYSYGMSGAGATVVLWALIALIYDFSVNAPENDGFSEFDAAATLGIAIVLRMTGYIARGGG